MSVGELGSISAAARAHQVSQPAASMRLRSLEGLLGLQLLERAHAGARLTSAGEATAEWAATVLGDMRTLIAGTTALRSDERSNLRVASSFTVAEYLVPAWLQQLASVAPDVTVSLVVGNTATVNRRVLDAAVDFGFIEGARPPASVRSRDIVDDELVIVVGNRHPWARRRHPLTPTELAAAPILLREQGSGTRDTLTAAMADQGLSVQTLMELGSTTAIKSAVAAGTGPSVLSRLAVESELETGQLVTVPVAGLRLDRTLRAIWRRDHALTAPARRLLAIAVGRADTT